MGLRGRCAALAACGLLLLAAACGGGGSAPEPTPTPAAQATSPAVAPTVARSPVAAASPSAAPGGATATNTTAPAAAPKPTTVYVGNTDGQGVYIRKSPAMADRVRAYADGTALTIIGEDVEGEGQTWHHVRAPDGLEGFVPSMYTIDTRPSG
jgi:hypothetical protein